MSTASNGGCVESDLARWIEAARQGSEEALGRILEQCRPYLLVIANQEIAPDLQAKVAPSDLVQETFLEAHQDFRSFQGMSREELLAWLRSILRNNLANVRRKYRETDKRQISREISLRDTPYGYLLKGLADSGETPSEQLIDQEEDQALVRALGQLPEEYRQVIQLREYENCSYEAIAQRMGRSAEAARKLHTRAVDLLGQLLESMDDSPRRSGEPR
jgi:RNA polymerase sigma-70 factor (ECF subfamily)